MFNYQAHVRLHHTDAAQRIFFTKVLEIAHDAYESFLEFLTYNLSYALFDESFAVTIVHAEADYKAHIKAGDVLTYQLRIDAIGKSSFTLTYDVITQECDPVAAAKTVHVFIDKKSGEAIDIPKDFRESLQNLQHDDASDQVF